MDFRVLGPLQVVEDGRSLPLGGHRQRMVLATLLVHANEVVSTDRLIDAVWGDEPPPTARKSLQAYTSRLRKVIGDEIVRSEPPGYSLEVCDGCLDAGRFERLAAEAGRVVASDPDRALELVEEAQGLWRGMPWGDLADEVELRADAGRLNELRTSVAEVGAEAKLALERATEALSDLEALVIANPLRERPRLLLMEGLYRVGRQADALAVYQDLRQVLGSELGVEPSPAIQALEEQILLHDHSLGGAVPVQRRSARNPFKGLRPFGEADADDFFGRGELTRLILDRLQALDFVAVVGPSGCGKSSVVRAGVLPAVRTGEVPDSNTWTVAVMRPGSHPFEEMEAALLRAAEDPPSGLGGQRRGDDLDLLRCVLRIRPSDESTTLLVIDQFEELFVHVDPRIRDRFVRNLLEAVEDPLSRLRVLVTLRADFFDRPLEYPRLGRLITDGQVNVLPIAPPEIEAATVRPAEAVGVGISPDLVAQIVADVARQPGALPLYQFVMTELFDRRQSDRLSIAEYRELGALDGALSRIADEIYDTLDATGKAAARELFLRLATVGETGDPSGGRVRRSELETLFADPEIFEVVLDAFGTQRLLSFDRDAVSNEPTVEVAHEALFDGWARLRTWIEEARSDLGVQRMLSVEARQWQVAGRDDDYLLTGNRLDLVEDWSASTTLALNSVERDFVEAGLARRRREEEEDRERLRREGRLERLSVRRLRTLTVVLAVAALMGTVLTAIALNRSQVAANEARRAEAQAEAAREARDDQIVATQTVRIKELTASSVASLEADPELSLLLALHAVHLSDTIGQPILSETVTALHWGLQASGVQFAVGPDPVVALVSGPDGPHGIFFMPVGDLVDVARSEVSRGLTDEECDFYFDEGLCPTLPTVLALTVGAETSQVVPAEPGRPLAGTSVSIFGWVTGHEADALRADFELLTERTGIRVSYEGGDDSSLGDVLRSRLDSTDPPDLLLLAQPSLAATMADERGALDLSEILDVEALIADQSPHLVSLVTVAPDGTWPAERGRLVGAFVRLNAKGLIWYPRGAFEEAGYAVPGTWEELGRLVDQIVADGRTPWCHGEASGMASGWPGTDWIEDIVLHVAGPEVYDQWVSHEVGFSSEPIRSAFEQFDELVLADGHVVGGRRGAAAQLWTEAPLPMVEDPPGCWLYHFASFAADFLPADIEVGGDVSFFVVEPELPDVSSVAIGGGDVLVALTDRPEVREVIRFMVGPEFGLESTKRLTGVVSPNQRFSLDEYQSCDSTDVETRTCVPSPHGRLLAEHLTDALAEDTFRLDASDRMPDEIGLGAFWDAMVEFVGEGPDNLERILDGLDERWDGLTDG